MSDGIYRSCDDNGSVLVLIRVDRNLITFEAIGRKNMRKIFYFVYTASIIYLCILLFLDYSNFTIEKIESNKSQVIIDKPDYLSNEEFVSLLKECAGDLNTDIMYSVMEHLGQKMNWSYYTTANSASFLDIGIPDIEKVLRNHNAISTKFDENGKAYPLIGSCFFYNITIYSFDEIKEYNLESCYYYLDSSMVKAFSDVLSEKNIKIEVMPESIITNDYFSMKMLVLPIIMLSLTAILWTISKRKSIVCKKLMGYSKKIIILEDFFYYCIPIICSGIGITILNGIFVNIFYRNTFREYINFCVPQIFSWILFILFILTGSSIVNVFSYSSLYLKGKKDSYDLYIITLFSKVVLSVMIVVKLSIVVLELLNVFNINRVNKEISQEIANYVILPVSASSVSINQDNQLEFNRRLDLFYEDTVEQYNGILINTRNFRNNDLNNNDSMAQKYGQNSITINENYLELNNIRDTKGDIIDESFFRENKMNLLLPEDTDEQKIKNKYAKSLSITEDDIWCIYYKKGEIIRTFNPLSGRGNNGVIENPIIEIYDPKYLKGQMLNYVSGQYYFLNIKSSNPYEEIKPLLVKYGIDNIILQTMYISNVFNNSASKLWMRFLNDTIMTAIYLASMILLAIYNIKIYFFLYERQIAVKKLSGMGFIEIFWPPILLILLQYCGFWVIRDKMSMGKEAIIAAMILEIVGIILLVLIEQRNHILNIIRGENT